MDRIRVFASATVANVACGFDVLGFAIHEPGDEIVLEKNDTGTLIFGDITGDNGVLPHDVEKNSASVVIGRILQHLKIKDGFTIHLHKKMPLGSGLGSSAASSAAGAFAINVLLGNPLSTGELLPFAMEGERIACGSAHADNIAPALLGGFVFIRAYNPLDVIRLPSPSELYAVVIHPQIEIQTRDAREILKKEITLKNAVKQWGNVGGFVAALYTNDYNLLSRSMVDHIVEPIRSILIPGYDEVKTAALKAGALGCGISGSGPSLFALCRGKETALKTGDRMARIFQGMKIESEVYISEINQKGPQVLY